MQAGTEKDRARSQIPKTLSRLVRRMLSSIVSKAALKSRRVRIEIEPEAEAVRRSFKTQRRAVSVLCFGDKLIGRCAKDCCGRDDGKVGQEQVSQ